LRLVVNFSIATFLSLLLN